MLGLLALTLLSLHAALAAPNPKTTAPPPARPGPDPSLATSVVFQGQTFVNKGMVAFGLIPSDARDSFGETIGGIGSAIALERGTFRFDARTGTFSGALAMQPDRGFNVIAPVDFQGRRHVFDFVLTPYYGVAPLSFAAAQQTLTLDYRRTTLYFEREHTRTSGLDALAVRPPSARFADPEMPIALTNYTHLTLDCEGLVANADGTYWVGDEYGAYIYWFDARGHLLHTIQPPQAAVPRIGGAVNFTSETDPDSGRVGNQGFEGLSASPDGRTLYGFLQSALVQDGGLSKATNRFARLFAWDVSRVRVDNWTPPPLLREWVVPLPLNAKGNGLGQSELHVLGATQFLTLARDGNGHGDTNPLSAYKSIDLVDVSGATDVHGTGADAPTGAVAPGGVLNPGVVPALYQPFVSLINATQLARFGLHNGLPADATLIDAKWEGLALAPAMDPAFPDDYFLFTASDNDFITENGISVGQPYNASENVDTQAMVFRVTLPSVRRGDVERSIGI